MKKAAHGRAGRDFWGDQFDHPKSTADRLAVEHSVGPATVRRAAKFAEEVEKTPELKKAHGGTGANQYVQSDQIDHSASTADRLAVEHTPDPEPGVTALEAIERRLDKIDRTLALILERVEDLAAAMKPKQITTQQKEAPCHRGRN